MTSDARAETLARLRADQRPSLIGVGAIGSWVARWMTANGIRFTAWDDDVVALKNLAAGAFAPGDVGRAKAVAVSGDYARRWMSGCSVTTGAIVCADDGPTRRAVARACWSDCVPFVCAKANGRLWQVWNVPCGASPDDFCAFDEAAEVDPVTVPCGDSSVGRVASIGAAAELLSAWAGFDVTPAEVESAMGETFDPGIGHALATAWSDHRAAAEVAAAEVARDALAKAIDAERTRCDERAAVKLASLRDERKQRRKQRRSTIHQRATVALDTGTGARTAAREAVGVSRPLQALASAENRMSARALERSLAIPETMSVEEVSA